jgi:hypothetical protein
MNNAISPIESMSSIQFIIYLNGWRSLCPEDGGDETVQFSGHAKERQPIRFQYVVAKYQKGWIARNYNP